MDIENQEFIVEIETLIDAIVHQLCIKYGLIAQEKEKYQELQKKAKKALIKFIEKRNASTQNKSSL